MAALIIIYLVLICGLTIYLSKRVKSSEDYFLAGRTLPWYVVGLGLASTGIGGGAVIGFPGAFYAIGIDWYFMSIGAIVAELIVVLFIAEKLRAMNSYTVPEMIEMRFDRKARIAAAVLIIVGDIAMICSQILAFSGTLSGFLGLNQEVGSIVGTVIFIVTTMFGGLIGVAITDAIQAVFLLGGITIVGSLVFAKAGGFSQWSTLPLNYTKPLATLPKITIFGNVVSLMGVFLGSQSQFVSRINAARTPKDAKKATYIHLGTVILLLGIVMPLVGYSAHFLLGPGISSGEVMGQVIANVLPSWAGALYVAIIIGAILTTVNSLLISVSMNVVKDLLETSFPEKGFIEKDLLKWGRIATIGIGILAYVMTKAMPNLINSLVFAFSMVTLMCIPLYGGLLWKRPGARGGFWSIILGGGATVIWQFVLHCPWGLHSLIPGLILGFLGLAIGCIDEPISEDRWKRIRGNES